MGDFELGNDGPKVVVVGMDGSRTSMRAAAYAAGLARRQSARLVVVNVRAVPTMASLAPLAIGSVREAMDQTSDELRQQVEDGARRVGVKAEFVTVDGEPFAELARVADELMADAVVVGASSHAGHRVVGSIAIKLVRAERWPVTVVP